MPPEDDKQVIANSEQVRGNGETADGEWPLLLSLHSPLGGGGDVDSV